MRYSEVKQTPVVTPQEDAPNKVAWWIPHSNGTWDVYWFQGNGNLMHKRWYPGDYLGPMTLNREGTPELYKWHKKEVHKPQRYRAKKA